MYSKILIDYELYLENIEDTFGIEQKNTYKAQIQMIEMYFIIISSLLYGKRQNYYFTLINISDVERSPDKKIGHLKKNDYLFV